MRPSTLTIVPEAHGVPVNGVSPSVPSSKPTRGRGRGSFTLEVHSPTTPRSPSPSPSSGELTPTTRMNKFTSDTPGNMPQDVYDQTMGKWRAAVRRRLVRSVEWESKVIAAMQERVRTPWLDWYFVYTSSLGTHTFFMTALPACYFFGYPDLARGLVIVLALGVYAASFIKDLLCSPRPFAPPVTRLTIGSHHLEYGFPSTHSTNSVSIALFIFTHVYRLHAAEAISDGAFQAFSAFLALYAVSIVYGRLYTAMHSFSDCAVGVLLGTAIWAMHWACEDVLKVWVEQGGWGVPLITILLCSVMVHKHPQPVDDCPCFEDAIAFVSVVMGILLGWWHGAHYGFPDSAFTRLMPGSAFLDWADVSLWWLFAAVKMVVGILVIFTWRIAAKSFLHLGLPPTFRLLAHAITLPHRRFYTPATDYSRVPPEKGLHPIPSVIDLPAHLEMETEGRTGTLGVPAAAGSRLVHRGGERTRRDVEETQRFVMGGGEEKARVGMSTGDVEVVKHYDADVITKVIVYCGIALLASYGLPVMFEILGWGVRSSSR